jgi:transposase-like protein
MTLACPKCGRQRTIRMGLTQSKVTKQRYWCYTCKKLFYGPYQYRAPKTNASGTSDEEVLKEK